MTPRAIAIAFQGSRIGAWWHPDWSESLHKLRVSLAGFVAWLRPPVGMAEVRSNLFRFLERHPAQALASWLVDLPAMRSSTFAYPPLSVEWHTVLRSIFHEWKPTREMMTNLFETLLRPRYTDLDLFEFLWNVSLADPIVFGRLLEAWLYGSFLNRKTTAEAQAFLRDLYLRLAGLPKPDQSEIDALKKRLQEAAAYQIGSNREFVKGLLTWSVQIWLRKTLPPLEVRNVYLALTIAPFRELLTLELLEIILRRIKSSRR